MEKENNESTLQEQQEVVNEANENKEEENEVIEINYEAAKVSRLFSAHFFDIFVMAVLGALLLIPSMFILQNLPVYKDNLEARNTILLASQLYTGEGENVTPLSTSLSADDTITYNEKSEKLDTALTYFFSTFITQYSEEVNEETYLEYKANATSDNSEKLFDESYQRALVTSTYDETYYNFYSNVLSNRAVGYLELVPEYVTTRRNYVLGYVLGIAIPFVLSIIVIYYVIPMSLNRGKRTLGMLLSKLSYVQADGFSVSNKRYTLHFVCQFFLVFCLSVVSFLAPIIISVTMLFLSKNHQTFSDYMTGCYLVSSDDTIIYKDYEDYCFIKEIRKEGVKKGLTLKSK